VSAPVVIDSKGRRWTNELWAKDLALHLDYIADLTLGCPVEYREPHEQELLIEKEPFDQVRFIYFPASKNHLQGIVNLWRFVPIIWRGVASCEIVHTGFGGWPISEGWFAVPIGKMLGRFVIINVESSFWRTKSNASLQRRIRSRVIERVNRFCIKLADLRLFTSRAYAEELLPGVDQRVYVVPATWVDNDTILNERKLERAGLPKSGK